MALRARAASTNTQAENMLNRDLPGKTFTRAAQPAIKARAALGDIQNVKNGRSASVTTDQPTKEIAKITCRPNVKKAEPLFKENQVPKLSKNEIEIEPMEMSGIEVENDTIEDIDKEDVGNPQLVVEYVRDIYNYLRFLEREQSITANYLANQQTILPKMRTVLVDWLVGVHLQFRLLPETVYTTVAILDRFLMVELGNVTRNKLQLVGVAAMLVASKYEEIYAPEVKDFVYITDKAYTEKEILKMELNILHVLEFNLGRPLPLHFLRRASKAGGVEAVTHTLAKYVMELSLGEYSLAGEPPSRLAAAALALSIRLLEPGLDSMKDVWSSTLQHYTSYELSELTGTIVQLAGLLRAAPTAKLTAVYQKYSNRKFMKIARIPALDDPILAEIADGQL